MWTARAANNHHSSRVPVVIVGAGPSGLFLSRLLDSFGTPSIVLEASPSLTTHPQAHFLNTRTMEVLRHSLPTVYKRVRQEMPPVEEWKTFRFGYDMNNCMAQVIHPVDRPLQANVDANGRLVPIDKDFVESETTEPLSACSVGHLAQHTFCRLLDEAEAPLATVHYDMPIVDVEFVEEKGLYRVYTRNETTFEAPIVVAADGFHSTLRKLWKIDMDGQEGIQHLINVHIRADSLLLKEIPPAMLYSIFNPSLVGMMVRHSPQEYVLQIPYFPPYQTVECNFSQEKVQAMVKSAFGTSHGITVESIRPWTMSSLVARTYVNKTGGGVLVGDAAHVFPPAGGFGMNSGLHDVHNLAWRLSLWHKSGQRAQQLPEILSKYESERRSIAQRNAALSVRNYHRVLDLSKACYLNEQHPALLLSLLDQMTLLPLSSRQTMFQKLLVTAMFPLSALQNPSNPHTRLVTRNVRNILEQGGGLPLLFPSFELGFGYGSDDKVGEDAAQDSMGYTPQLREGYLFPHVDLEVVEDFKENRPNFQLVRGSEDSSSIRITSSDLPSQLRCGEPCFVLLSLNCTADKSNTVYDALSEVKAKSDVHVASVQVVTAARSPIAQTDGYDLVLRDDDSKLSKIAKTNDPVLILIRPDGHIANIVHIQEQNASYVAATVLEGMDKSFGV